MSIDRWLAIVALVIALFGGVPGFFQVLAYLRPVSLTGSIKFVLYTSPRPGQPNCGIIAALTLVNEGTKPLVWRKVDADILVNGKTTRLQAVLIREQMVFQGKRLCEADLLKTQVLEPGQPVNGYMGFDAVEGSVGSENAPPSEMHLRFELESGRTVKLALPIPKTPIEEASRGEFPTHGIQF